MSPVRGRAWRRAGLVLALVLGADQLTKILVRSGVEKGDSDPIFPLLKLVHVDNRGVAFGAFADNGQEVVLAIVAVALAGLIVYFATHTERRGVWLATGLLLGGALGNVIDRVAFGAVTDFLKLPGWPAFNLADVAITVGVIALLIVVEQDDDAGEGDVGPDAAHRTGDDGATAATATPPNAPGPAPILPDEVIGGAPRPG